MGIGAVGLRLCLAFVEKYTVIAYEPSKSHLEAVKCETDNCEGLILTDDPSLLKDATHVLIAVPTLLKPCGQIETMHLQNALDIVSSYCKHGTTVITESSVVSVEA